MIAPIELQSRWGVSFDGVATTTDAVWQTLRASREGYTDRVRALIDAQPILACCKYNYAMPLHFAVREGHTDLVRLLIERGGLQRGYHTDGFGDSLMTLAKERGHAPVEALLQLESNAPACVAPTDDVRFEFPEDDARIAFRSLLDAKMSGSADLSDVERAIEANPGLAIDPLQNWVEGVLATPANAADLELIELLMQYGARVPDVTKWCARYYFKHEAIAALFMERGMNPNHMNWHHVTLLHELAFTGEMYKARLLVNRGADINALDEEFQSTPLGLAARGGQRAMVKYLLDCGADKHKAGAPWATPVAWARARHHTDIVELLGD